MFDEYMDVLDSADSVSRRIVEEDNRHFDEEMMKNEMDEIARLHGEQQDRKDRHGSKKVKRG